MEVRVGPWRKLSTEELVLLNCGVGGDSWEHLGLQEDPVNPSKGDQSWVFIGRTDVEAEAPILWPPHAKSWLIWKDPDAGKDWGQEEKGTTEDEMAGWHHRLSGDESGWTLGVGDGQGGLAFCGPWGRKESDTTDRLNWTELKQHSNNYCVQESSRDAKISWWKYNEEQSICIVSKWLPITYKVRGYLLLTKRKIVTLLWRILTHITIINCLKATCT